ncbi:MAG: hypothetical protein WBA74_15365 [Cyclobacteriaceae bacterium]
MKSFKISLTIVLLIAATFSVVAQSAKENIREGFIAQATAMKDKDFEKSIEYTADELFNLVPKEQMLTVITATFNNPNLEIVSTVPKIVSIADVEKINEKYYAIIVSEGIQKMRMYGDDMIALGLDNATVASMKSSFDASFGEENVKFDDETKFFEVFVKQKAVAISKDGKTDWKYLTIEKSLYPMLAQLLPEEVIKKVKS